ncbi:PDR/VanB family oxidoreductase [Peristeroidobacter soli]|jgi:vanillate O-demethylase ferredoxin subunit|uniref:PDR/VanB family oxidoreductase n=1 Tax=Peristeroidobacter soli TaxID=2497877 RepID=UPI00101DA400|nr:PDR/VanB family oxidoreductase [Peristeroidobacter soli]
MIHSWLQLKVAARREEAQQICSFELIDPQGRALPPFTPGAHVDVELGPGMIRQYSLCNDPSEQHRYLIAALREPEGRGGSVALHDTVKVADVIRVSEPKNHFPLAANADRHLLLAGGIGVTPLLAMAEYLSRRGLDFEMHYCTRSRARAAFLERIRQSTFAKQACVHFDDGPDEQRFDANQVLGEPLPGTHIYVCGPSGFMSHVLQTAKARGWPDGQTHREYFAPAEQSATPAGQFEVELASSGQVFVIPADKPIVEVLLDQGIEIPTSCDQGVCGTCLTRVISGVPDHRDSFLTDQERARNDQMTPCCSRAKSSRLVLDL